MPTDAQSRRSLARWIVPVVTFVAGAVLGVALLKPSAPPAPAQPQISVPTFGASAPVASGGGGGGAESALRNDLALQLEINDRFVDQLRTYDARLREIADGSAGTVSPEAAQAMRDFALETKLLIDRYDMIAKEN